MDKSLSSLKSDLSSLSDKSKASLLQRFFKTGKGEYAEGDVFLGISVPEQRKIAKKYSHLSLKELQTLLNSKIHEERLISLLILIEKYKHSKGKEELVSFYLKNTKNINNWDLVDLSSHKILGDYLINKDKSILYKLARSENLWEKRISIVSTFAFIRNNDFSDSLKISEILLKDRHDLIHKAVGWVLREIGKKDIEAEKELLKRNYKSMPRTMLRYAIERFPERERMKYLKGEI